MSEALALYDRIENPMQAVETMGNFLATSGMFGCEKKEQGQVLALACMCERKSPFEILKTYHIINGKLSMRADAMLAGFRKAGGKVTWKRFDNEAAIAVWTLDNNKDVEIGFTVEDAKRAGLIPAKPGSGWQKSPDAMLRARCISKAMRMIAPEVVAGTYTPEEVADFSDTTPVKADLPTATVDPVAEKKGPGRPKKEPEAAAAEAAKPVETKVVDAKPVEQPKAVTLSPAPPVEKKPEAPAAAEPKADANPLPDKWQVVEVIINAGKVTLNGAEVPVTRDQVKEYCYTKGLIEKGVAFEKMPDSLMERICAKPDAFLRAVAGNVTPKK